MRRFWGDDKREYRRNVLFESIVVPLYRMSFVQLFCADILENKCTKRYPISLSFEWRCKWCACRRRTAESSITELVHTCHIRFVSIVISLIFFHSLEIFIKLRLRRSDTHSQWIWRRTKKKNAARCHSVACRHQFSWKTAPSTFALAIHFTAFKLF